MVTKRATPPSAALTTLENSELAPSAEVAMAETTNGSAGMLVGESITNIANIYFDFNEPVITEPCLFAVEVPTAVDQAALTGVTLHPNPTDHVLNLSVPDDRSYYAEILTVDGRTVRTLGSWRSKAAIQVSSLPPGSYLLRLIADDQEQLHLRFVKQ